MDTPIEPTKPWSVIIEGDCVEFLKNYPENSVDAIVTDPPYGLKFMGKDWDNTGHGSEQQAWHYRWAVEAIRVLKPGGHLLAFGGTRTYHRLASAIEDAGFEIRDQIQWLYGSGFPKSHNISKAIDKAGGVSGMNTVARVALAREIREKRESVGVSRSTLSSWFPEYKYVTENWERTDVGFRIPSLRSYATLVDRLGISNKWLEMVRTEDLRTKVSDDGTDRRDDGTVYSLGMSGVEYEHTTPEAIQWEGWGTALKPAHEPIVLARKPFSGTVAANVLKHGVGGLNVDATRVAYDDAKEDDTGQNYYRHRGIPVPHTKQVREGFIAPPPEPTVPTELGRWPANIILDEEAGEILDEQSGLDTGASGRSSGPTRGTWGTRGIYGTASGDMGESQFYGDKGGASRFFYCPKASKAEREAGLEPPEDSKRANTHPTVKPISLMEYLVRLVTPPGGLVLDPFVGSGTTGIAAFNEGFDFIGIEVDPEYCDLSRTRIEHHITQATATE